MKKRLAAMAMAVCTVMTTLAGCGGSSGAESTAAGSTAAGTSEAQQSTDASGSSSEKEPVTLEFWTLALSPTFDDYINGVIEDFESQYDWITIDWEDVPREGYEEKLITRIASDNAPDVVNIWTIYLMGLAGNGALVNLYEEATEEQLSIYQENLFSSISMNGGLYGFPWYVTPPVSTYNTELFEKAGLDHVPADYNEMMEMAPIMKEKTGAYLYVPNEMCQVLYANGIELISEDKKSAVFNTPEAAELLTKMQQGVREGWLPKQDWNDWPNMITLYSQEKLALIGMGAQTVDRIISEAPNLVEKTDVTKPILGTAGIAQGALQSLSIPTASKHHEEAILFANFLSNDANQLEFCHQDSIMPTTKEAAKDPYFTSDTETLQGRARKEAAEAVSISFDLGLGVANESEVVETIRGMYESIMQADRDVQEVLDETEKKVNELINEE